tara:strand:+ start:583 stop:735 length:153 start_codon:yes stop_codon:yes gene_type:complete
VLPQANVNVPVKVVSIASVQFQPTLAAVASGKLNVIPPALLSVKKAPSSV